MLAIAGQSKWADIFLRELGLKKNIFFIIKKKFHGPDSEGKTAKTLKSMFLIGIQPFWLIIY